MEADSSIFAPEPFHLRLRGALSHYDINDVEAQTGGTWGVDGILPVGDQLGAYGAYKLNFFDDGHQTLASGGAYRQAVADGLTLLDRIGVAAVYDYFSDSRGIDLDLTQLRYQIGYLFAPNWAAGFRGSFGIEDEINPLFFNPDAAPGATALFKASDFLGGFVTGYFGSTMVDFGVGRRDWISGDATEFGLAVREQLTPRLFGYIDTSYATHGSWMAFAGLEFRFGAVKTALSPKEVAAPRRMAWDDPTIATIFNSGEAKTFFGVSPQGASTPPTESEEEEEYQQDPQ